MIYQELGLCDTNRLEHVARYAEELAEHKERDHSLNKEIDEGNDKSESTDLPDSVPSKATIMIKEINDNRYYYWRWREGDRVKSKYKEPVSE